MVLPSLPKNVNGNVLKWQHNWAPARSKDMCYCSQEIMADKDFPSCQTDGIGMDRKKREKR